MLARVLLVSLLLAPSTYAATFTVVSSGNAGAGTLRQAILDANANPGTDQIVFSVATVTLSAQLPDITDPVNIDGSFGGGRVAIGGLCSAAFAFRAGSSGSTLTRVTLPAVACGAGVIIDTTVTNVTVTDIIVVTITVLGTNNHIGGTTAGSGNDAETVWVKGANNEVLRNTVDIVSLENATANRIGSVGNGNSIQYMPIFNSPGTIVEGNTFALVDLSPPAAAILIIPPNPASNTTIVQNTISGYERGIAMFSDGPNSGFTFTRNSIFDISQFPIDLGIDGITPNDAPPDADTGANNLQNFPILTSAAVSPTQLTVTGSLSSVPLTNYRIEVFGNDGTDPEARTFLGSFTVMTNAAGTAAFTQTLTTLPALSTVVTATATNLTTGDTSELSAPAVVLQAPDVTPIPTLSTWSLIALALGLALVTLFRSSTA